MSATWPTTPSVLSPMPTPDLLSRNRLERVRLADLTTMRIGGPADLLWLEDRRDLPEVIEQPHRWLGKGANLLVGDDGVPGLVVKLGAAFDTMETVGVVGGVTTVRVGAAFDLAKLIGATVKAGLAGPEGLAGVPATVGGALRMNAGTNTTWILDHATRVEVVLPGTTTPRWIERADLPAAYRTCGLPSGVLFLSCEMALPSEDPAVLQATATRLKQAKAATQPLAQPSAGCVFKNPRPDLPAGKLIDELGLKGTRIGGAEISTIHGNFIINPGRSAFAGDVAALVRLIRTKAWKERGVEVNMEIETWACPADLHVHPKELV